MKSILALVVGAAIIAGFAQGASAQSASAYDNANCHASFLNDCAGSADSTSGQSPDSDAPLPLLGAGPLALAALGASIVIGCRRRSMAG